MSNTTHAAPTNWQRVVEIRPERPRLGSGHRTLGRVVRVLLAGSVGASVLTVMINLYGLVLFSGWEADPSSIVAADGRNFDTVNAAIAGVWLLVYLTCCVCAVTWLFQAYGSREADPDLLKYKRWWVIGGWLIPFISIVRPFQVVRDLYLATSPQSPDLPGARVRCPDHFRWWWGAFILGGMVSYIGFRLMLGDPDIGQVQAAVAATAVSHMSLAAAGVLFIGVLRSISNNLWRQDQIEKWSSESTATATNTSVR